MGGCGTAPNAEPATDQRAGGGASLCLEKPEDPHFRAGERGIEGRNSRPSIRFGVPGQARESLESLKPCQRAVSAYSTTMLSATIRMFQSGYAWG
jgi:hypothetical protein